MLSWFIGKTILTRSPEDQNGRIQAAVPRFCNVMRPANIQEVSDS